MLGRLFGRETFGEIRCFSVGEDEDSTVNRAAFSDDGARVISGSDLGSIRVWNTQGGGEVRRLETEGNPPFTIALSSDGGRALSVAEDETESILAHLWTVGDGTEVSLFQVEDDVNCTALSPDGGCVLTGCLDGSIGVWDAESGRRLRRLEGHSQAVTCVSFAPDGKQALSGGLDAALRLWDTESGAQLRRLKTRALLTTSLICSPNGGWILYSGGNGEVSLVNAETGRLAGRLGGTFGAAHGAGPVCMAFSPDGRRALTGGRMRKENPVRLWDIERGRELRRFAGHEGLVLAVAFSADGQAGLSAGEDGAVRTWELPLH